MRSTGSITTTHFQSNDDHYHQQQQHSKKESNNTTTTTITLNPSSPSLSNTPATCLKLNKDSRAIKKSLPPSSSSPALLNNIVSLMSNNNNNNKPQPQPQPPPPTPPQPQQQRHPVIIYTHSPTVIKTNPKDFMSLVQKLTGLTRGSEGNQHQPGSSSSSSLTPSPPLPPLQQPRSEANNYEDNNNIKRNGSGNLGIIGDDCEITSVSTDETKNNGGGGFSDLPVINSCYIPSPMFDHPPNLCFSNNNNNNNGIPFFNPNSAEFLCTSQPFYNSYSDPSSFCIPPPNIRSSYSSSSSLDAMNDLPDF